MWQYRSGPGDDSGIETEQQACQGPNRYGARAHDVHFPSRTCLKRTLFLMFADPSWRRRLRLGSAPQIQVAFIITLAVGAFGVSMRPRSNRIARLPISSTGCSITGRPPATSDVQGSLSKPVI